MSPGLFIVNGLTVRPLPLWIIIAVYAGYGLIVGGIAFGLRRTILPPRRKPWSIRLAVASFVCVVSGIWLIGLATLTVCFLIASGIALRFEGALFALVLLTSPGMVVIQAAFWIPGLITYLAGRWAINEWA